MILSVGGFVGVLKLRHPRPQLLDLRLESTEQKPREVNTSCAKIVFGRGLGKLFERSEVSGFEQRCGVEMPIPQKTTEPGTVPGSVPPLTADRLRRNLIAV